MTHCTIERRDIEELKRLHMAVVRAGRDLGNAWRAWAEFNLFIEKHPTLVNYLCRLALEIETRTERANVD